ncbi:MAG: cytochrome c biogenesis protein CcsA [Flavobacteriales bacterium]|nr:cytochrome c biogenesis protein CcsA [Flavobacteriales bacterium]
MEEINYIGEHLWAGRLGHALLILSMVSVLFSAISYFFSEQYQGDPKWSSWGKWAFRVHSLSLVGAIAILFIMLGNAWYEYDYVWKHRNNAMPMRYILSCFWEGHEGSFLLWSFWHMVLGNLLIRSAGKWTAPVMTFIAAANVFLGSMVLGIYLGDLRIGSSPFLLLRELPSNIGLPWTQFEDYLSRFPQFMDGRGLNPLLQNYWMTIHPPTVFFGFASTIVPAAFAVAGLWRKQYHQWIRPALPWTYLGILVLGVGILMGGAWAYEALSFGGFWAWDPVENSSLVPWLIIVSAGHVMLVNRNKARSTYSALLLALASFIFVIYSNFLTNSGVLGDTSVHAFTDNGLGGQLVVYMTFFITVSIGMLMTDTRFRRAYWLASVLTFIVALFSGQRMIALHVWLLASLIMSIISYQKHYPKEKEEEKLWSREFWMFIGSLVIVMSALQITFMTSKPVFNVLATPLRGSLEWLAELLNSDGLATLAAGQLSDKGQDQLIADYNKWQTPFAFVVTMMVAFTQFLRWKDTPLTSFFKQISISALIAVIATSLTVWYFSIPLDGKNLSIILLFFGCWWAVTGNLDYLLRVAKNRVRVSGSSIAHVGFGLVLLGAAVSTSQSKKISQNTSLTDITKLSDDFSNREDILLFQKDTLIMGNYFVSFQDKYRDDVNIYFQMDYFDLSPKTYQEGDFIYMLGEIYRAKEEHPAGLDMMQDIGRYWEPYPDPSPEEVDRAALWTPYEAGERLFRLEPRIQLNPKFGNVPEPDTKHYLDRDVYTHVRYGQLDNEDTQTDAEGYLPFKDHQLAIGDTLRSGARLAIVDSLVAVKDLAAYGLEEDDLAVKAMLRVVSPDDTVSYAEPIFVLKNSEYKETIPYVMEDKGVKFQFTEIRPQESLITIQVAEKEENLRDFIVMQAIMFPWINILWVGIIVMAIGIGIAVVQRFKRNRQNSA